MNNRKPGQKLDPALKANHRPGERGNKVEFKYSGRIYVRPVGRGVVLLDLHEPLDEPQIEDVLDEGYYAAEIIVVRDAIQQK